MNHSEFIFNSLHKEEIAKGENCWHKGWSSYCKTKCLICGKLLHVTSESPNPDYTTYPGFFELKAECEKRGWWQDFVKWTHRDILGISERLRANTYGPDYDDVWAVELHLLKTLPVNVTESPDAFYTFIYNYLKEKVK